MNQDIYAKLGDILETISLGVKRGPEFDTLLRALFEEEEARVAIHVSPMAPEPPERVAERMGEDGGKVARLLDRMADKGLIYCSQRGESKWYKLIQVVPGIFELQFMRGEISPRTKELARLFDAYFKSAEREGKKVPLTPFARVIPVEKTISSGVRIFPYETAAHYVEEAEMISLTTCYCRHEKRLLGHACDNPLEVCLQFGSFARFLIQRGFGRQITKEEAHAVLSKSREAGLIHTSNNTRDHVDFICNCCGCCCGILLSVKSSTMPSMAASSNYVAKVDPARCVACGECAERCHMEAISVDIEGAQVSLDRCVGCGVCANFCPSEAISLVPKGPREEPPENFKALLEKQIQEKIRLVSGSRE